MYLEFAVFTFEVPVTTARLMGRAHGVYSEGYPLYATFSTVFSHHFTVGILTEDIRSANTFTGRHRTFATDEFA